MARSLLELYRPIAEAGPKGPTLNRNDLETRWPTAAVAFDRDVAPEITGNPSFRQNGEVLNVSSGGRNWRWNPDDEVWEIVGGRLGAPDLENNIWTGRRGTAAIASVTDRFSQTFSEYVAAVSGAMARAGGARWESLIDSAYGPGAVKGAFRDLWKNLWTDHEAVGEMLHYYDVAQQAAQAKQHDRGRGGKLSGPYDGEQQLRYMRDAVGSYPMRIGPRFDVPADQWGDMGDDMYDPDGPYVRRQRVTDPEYFEGIMGHA